jgi:hypothetical protein
VIEMPARIARLRRQAGYPVPWFVAWIGGQADFRVIAPNRIVEAVNEHRCWICGDVLGRHLAFVIGPMCAVNRISSEPPCHRSCAEYAVQACPFLSNPAFARRETNKPAGVSEAAGYAIPRNPGVALVWNTETYKVMRVGADTPGANDGLLFQLGPPLELSWWAEGRTATRAEILASIESGLPLLRGAADDGPEAAAVLDKLVAKAMELVPA